MQTQDPVSTEMVAPCLGRYCFSLPCPVNLSPFGLWSPPLIPFPCRFPRPGERGHVLPWCLALFASFSWRCSRVCQALHHSRAGRIALAHRRPADAKYQETILVAAQTSISSQLVLQGVLYLLFAAWPSCGPSTTTCFLCPGWAPPYILPASVKAMVHRPAGSRRQQEPSLEGTPSGSWSASTKAGRATWAYRQCRRASEHLGGAARPTRAARGSDKSEDASKARTEARRVLPMLIGRVAG